MNHLASRCDISILVSLCKIEGWVTVGVAYHFALPGKQDEVAKSYHQHIRTLHKPSRVILDGHLASVGFCEKVVPAESACEVKNESVSKRNCGRICSPKPPHLFIHVLLIVLLCVR